jgi:hypothetical protein
VDGVLAEAQLAQSSGITTDGNKLYFTDSETSAVRAADLNSTGNVETIVGLHLLEFGYVDGVGEDVRLQHPISIDIPDGLLYIADTYNRIKKIDPSTREASGLIWSGPAGDVEGAAEYAQFHEPGGLSSANGNIYIADTIMPSE